MQQPALSSATPPPLRMVILAIQHVLVMYADAVTVPLILGAALKLLRDQVALLINADLFACGVATLIQAYGLGPVGIRLPVMMGVTFASLSPMLAMAANPALGWGSLSGLEEQPWLAISIGFGMIPLVAPTLFKAAPEMLRTILDSGVLLASVVAVALNVFFNPRALAADGHAAPVAIADHA